MSGDVGLSGLSRRKQDIGFRRQDQRVIRFSATLRLSIEELARTQAILATLANDAAGSTYVHCNVFICVETVCVVSGSKKWLAAITLAKHEAHMELWYVQPTSRICTPRIQIHTYKIIGIDANLNKVFREGVW